jgi:hypothetical protein
MFLFLQWIPKSEPQESSQLQGFDKTQGEIDDCYECAIYAF